MTFGQGAADNQTLPQYFADLSGRKIRVLNFAYPGCGRSNSCARSKSDVRSRPHRHEDFRLPGGGMANRARIVSRALCGARAARQAGRRARLRKPAPGLRRLYGDIIVLGGSFYQKLTPRLPGVDGRHRNLHRRTRPLRAAGQGKNSGAAHRALFHRKAPPYLAQTGFGRHDPERLRQGGVDVVDDTLSFGEFLPGTLFTIPATGIDRGRGAPPHHPVPLTSSRAEPFVHQRRWNGGPPTQHAGRRGVTSGIPAPLFLYRNDRRAKVKQKQDQPPGWQ